MHVLGYTPTAINLYFDTIFIIKIIKMEAHRICRVCKMLVKEELWEEHKKTHKGTVRSDIVNLATT
jgi:hypothetical protein